MQHLIKIKQSLFAAVSLWLAACLLCNCNDRKDLPNTFGTDYNRPPQSINLFPEMLAKTNGSAKLSYEAAAAQSELLLYTSKITLLDSSSQRSMQPVYLYKASQSQVIKPLQLNKRNNPILFLSREKLFNGKEYPDSTYLFLQSIKNYKVLRSRINIQYQWVNEAPLVAK